MMIRAILFDIDGTLLDSVDQHARSWQDTFAHFGYDFPYSKIRQQIGKGGDKLLAQFLTEEQIAHQRKEIEDYRGKLFEGKYLANCKPFPGVPELFQDLRFARKKIALASSAKKDEAETYTKMLGITRLIDAVVTKDDVGQSKPDPDALIVARQKLDNLPASECIFVGDSPHDAGAAQRDGMKMIGLLCGGFSERDLRDAGASEIFCDPEDLRARWSVVREPALKRD